ncbi:MAG: hypothetical protein U0359_01700 [Byssovorax sp.]
MNAPTRSASTLPPAIALAWAGLGAIAAVIALAILVRSPQSIAVPEEEGAGGPERISAEGAATATGSAAADLPALASSADLDAARHGGLSALEALAAQHPRDPAVQKALLLAQALERPRFGAAVETARRLFALSPESAGDPAVRRVFVRLASGPAETVDALFELIASIPGEAGPDLLDEIAGDDGALPKAIKDRAQKLADTPAMKAKSSEARQIAQELAAALPCARKALFARAKEVGDARSLPALKPLVSTAGCKKFFRPTDCYACLGNRADLTAAISAIEARSTNLR